MPVKLPVYEMVINIDENSDVEVSFVALVDKPAIERNFLMFRDNDYGGPGSGPQGGGGGDDDGGEDVATIAKIPRDQRSEAQIKKLFKTKPKRELKELWQGGKEWIKNNPQKVGTTEHRTISREVNVADKILKEVYDEIEFLDSKKIHFALDAEKRIISGPAMVADTLIYRRDDNGEYNVFFSKETIKEIALKFFKKDYHKNLNLFHDPSLSLEGVTIFESFISDKDRGISAMKGFEDLPDGTWFISAKIDNNVVWGKIKTGEVKGFSVEGIFSYIKKPAAMEEQIFAMLSETAGNKPLLQDKETIMKGLKEMFKEFKQKFIDPPLTPVTPNPGVTPAPNPAPVQTLTTDYTLKDGTVITCDKLEVGGVAMVGAAPAAPGEYDLSDGKKITVGEGGVISAVTPEAAPPLTMAEVELAINKALQGHISKLAEAQKTIELQKENLAKQDEKIAGLFSLIEKMIDSPTADPLDDKKDGFQSGEIKNKDAARKEFARVLAEVRGRKMKIA